MQNDTPRPAIVSVTKTANTGTRPFLALTDSGDYYWCKQLQNDHGPQSTINEVVCSVIGDALGAPVAPWSLIDVPPELVGASTPSGQAGVTNTVQSLPVFGSKLFHFADIWDASEKIRFTRRDGNEERIPRLIALGILCNAKDLQVIHDTSDDMRIYSVDHGMWFGSDESLWVLAPSSELYGRTEIGHPQQAIPKHFWCEALDAVASLSPDLKVDVLCAIPEEWEVPHHQVEILVQYCLDRREYTIERLRQEMLHV